nr:hypothetical protein [Tanacetum cinerariifolium]
MASSLAPQIDYALMVQNSSKYSPPEIGLVVLVFQKGDDPIDAINHMMSFLTAVVTSRVTIQPIQGRQNFVSPGSSRPFTSGSGGAPGKQRMIVCYNCKGEGHMSKQCTKPKRKRDAEWFKDKVLLVQAQANGQVLQEEELEFLADPGTAESSSNQTNSTLPALQDDLILSVIEQLNTQVVNCTKINQDNKQVNELLTAELERYRNQERVLNELKLDDKASTSYAPSLEIESLKHTLSEHLKEKESLEQKITILKNDFQKEESRNIDKELALEKQKVITKPIDYAIINQLSTDFETRFVPKIELSTEQAFWSKYSVQTDEPNLSATTTIVEVPKELPKVSLRNTVSSPESAPTFAELFEINDLKAQAQAKDTVILKLKEKLRSLNGDVNEINTYKQLYDSIKSSRVRSKEQCGDLINKVNLKSTEVSDLNASLQEKVLVITALKEQLNKLKGNANRTSHTDYIRHIQEEAATLREIIESKRLLSLLNTSLDYALGNVCPLTRIATAAIMPPKEPIPIVQSTDKPVVTLVYTRKPKAKNVPNKMEPNKSWGSSSNVSTSITDCRNDHVAKIMGYGDYQIGNVTISRVYYAEGAFRQHTYFIRNLEGVDLLT